MKSSTVLLGVAAMTFVVGCAPLRTPPTFGLTWVDSSLSVRTAESLNAVAFINQRGIPSATSQSGPAIGHDGNLTWLALWSEGSGFNFNTGVGGIPASGATGGIIWSTSIDRFNVPQPPAGSPSVAYGGGRWVVAFRDTMNRIHVVGSSPNSLSGWGPLVREVPTRTLDAAGMDPAIAYGNGRFVIAFHTGSTGPATTRNSIAVVQSTDGVTWTSPSIIGQTEGHPPGLTFGSGKFIAILTRFASLGAMRFVAHTSDDGQSWSGPAGEGGNFVGSQGPRTRPGIAYGQGILAVVECCERGMLSSWIGTPNNPASPTAFTFLPMPPLGTSIGVSAAQGTSASIAFGTSPP